MGFLRNFARGNIARGIGRGLGLAASFVGRGARAIGKGVQVVARALRSPTGLAIRDAVSAIPIVGQFVEKAARSIERIGDISQRAEASVRGVRGAVQSARQSARNIREQLRSGEVNPQEVANIVDQGRQAVDEARQFRQSLTVGSLT